MKKLITPIIILLLACVCSTDLFAGNKDRAGQAGATELLVNPWARSSGLHGMNSSFTQGLEAMRVNPAGLVFVNKTEVLFANTMWLKGSGVSLNAFGIAQKIGESSALGLSVTNMSFGELLVTTENDPEGNLGATYRPQLMNIGVSYAKSFSNSIHVGFLGRLISESIADATASGFAFDMGIQYVTGPKDNIRFGISLRNIGTPMRYSGDGLAIKVSDPSGDPYLLTVNQRTEKFELPSALNIGGSYDLYLDGSDMHRLTIMANFTSNSFSKDQVGGGLEYSFNDMFMLRGGYRYEEGITGAFSLAERSSAYTGLCAGASIQVPFKEDGPAVGVDYSFRASNPFAGTHTIGVRINL